MGQPISDTEITVTSPHGQASGSLQIHVKRGATDSPFYYDQLTKQSH